MVAGVLTGGGSLKCSQGTEQSRAVQSRAEQSRAGQGRAEQNTIKTITAEKEKAIRFRFRLRRSDLQSDSDLDSIRNSCDV